MEHFELGWQTGDGLVVYAQGWRPEGTPLGVLCLLHGIGEHTGRYAHVAAALCAAGYALVGHDLRGHGRSAGQKGHIPSYEALLDDAARLLAEARACFPGLPLFLYGHSQGGNLALNYALRRRPALAGVVATGPLLRLGFVPPRLKAALGRLLNNLWPTFSLASGLDRTALSRDPRVVEAYARDPLVHDRISSRFYVAFVDAGRWALDHAPELAVPTLLMHGGADRLASVAASREFAAAAGTGCTLKVWDGLYHEIHNEPEQARVLAFMLDWLEAQVNGRGADLAPGPSPLGPCPRDQGPTRGGEKDVSTTNLGGVFPLPGAGRGAGG